MTPELIAALADLKRRREQLDAALAEVERRRDRALAWMREKPTRTLFEAMNYVGAQSAHDDEQAAMAAFMAAADTVVAAAKAVAR